MNCYKDRTNLLCLRCNFHILYSPSSWCIIDSWLCVCLWLYILQTQCLSDISRFAEKPCHIEPVYRIFATGKCAPNQKSIRRMQQESVRPIRKQEEECMYQNVFNRYILLIQNHLILAYDVDKSNYKQKLEKCFW